MFFVGFSIVIFKIVTCCKKQEAAHDLAVCWHLQPVATKHAVGVTKERVWRGGVWRARQCPFGVLHRSAPQPP